LVLQITEEVCLSSFHFYLLFFQHSISDFKAQRCLLSIFSLPNNIHTHQNPVLHQISMNIKQPSFMLLKKILSFKGGLLIFITYNSSNLPLSPILPVPLPIYTRLLQTVYSLLIHSVSALADRRASSFHCQKQQRQHTATLSTVNNFLSTVLPWIWRLKGMLVNIPNTGVHEYKTIRNMPIVQFWIWTQFPFKMYSISTQQCEEFYIITNSGICWSVIF